MQGIHRFISAGLLSLLASWCQAGPELAGAAVYSPNIDIHAYLVSEKYDGVRAYWDGVRLQTRSGRSIPAPDGFLQQLPAAAVEGELWFGRGQFSRSSALIRRAPEHPDYDHEWQSVQLMLFDAPRHPGVFSERLAYLQQLQSPAAVQIRVARQWPVSSHDELQQQLQTLTAEGAEGLMLRRRDSLYPGDDRYDLLKLKLWDDAEAEVIGWIPGKGRLAGLMGSLLVRLDNGREIRIGTGFSDAERQQPPAIGTRITFQYQGFTSTGLPRFARYWRPRPQE